MTTAQPNDDAPRTFPTVDELLAHEPTNAYVRALRAQGVHCYIAQGAGSAPLTTAENIKNRRIALKLTQTEAARRMGVVQSRWAQLESEVNSPTVATLHRAAKVLECKASELV